ncbi:MAG: hypothetical protein ACREI3_00980 [Nitrospirales bacterium]
MRTTHTGETSTGVGTGAMRPVGAWGLVLGLALAAVTMVVLPPATG